MSTALSQYERTALQEINDWKSPEEQTWFGAIANAVSYPFDLAGDAVMSIPGAQTAVEKTVGGLISLLNDAAQWSIPANSAVEYYKGKKRSVNNRKDIFKLDLEEIDEAISYTGAKYRALAAAEGAGAGAVGVIGIPVDIVALVAMNLRAIGEYGTYCGFDMSKEHERLFAMRILGVSSSPTDAAKQVALAQLTKIGKEVAKKQTWKQLERHGFVRLIQEIAKSLGIRLTKAKLAQILPGVGAVIGGGFNAYYTGKTCTTAYYMYRERFLLEK